MMTSSNISSHNLLDPLLTTAHSAIQVVASPADDDGGHFCHDWVSHHHHHHQQAGSDDGLKQDEMDIENGTGVWVWEQKDDDHHGATTGDDFDSDDHDTQDNWVPSKLKVVKKMNPKRASTINPAPMVDTIDFPYFNDSVSNGGSNNGIRVCSDCNTTKTPLWRSGPNGPKSLCNACGIRQRKARRALAAASSGNAVAKQATSPKSLKVKISNIIKEKKPRRLKLAESSSTSTGQDDHDNGRKSGKETCFEEFMTMNLSKNSALQRLFPQDEKEAAILLMALSCGLVHHHHT